MTRHGWGDQRQIRGMSKSDGVSSPRQSSPFSRFQGLALLWGPQCSPLLWAAMGTV